MSDVLRCSKVQEYLVVARVEFAVSGAEVQKSITEPPAKLTLIGMNNCLCCSVPAHVAV